MYYVSKGFEKFWLTLQLTKEKNKLSALVRSAYILQEITGNAKIEREHGCSPSISPPLSSTQTFNTFKKKEGTG